jgi:PKD repeat protein
MRHSILTLLICFLIVQISKAQCPTTGFAMPDSVCAGQSFQITNSSTTGLSYQWDLCNGDLSRIPTGQNLGNIGPLTFPQQTKVITDNGKYFIFIANYVNGNLLRYDFGTSLDNTPVVYNYGNFTASLNQPIALDVIRENGIWYALVANNSNKKLFRINLGALIEANISSATDLGLFGLNNPKNLRIAKDGNNFHVFATNELGNDLIRIDFGTSIANTPTGFTALNNVLFVSSWGFDVAYDCTLSKYVGFLLSYTQSKLHILDFGSSLTNTPTIATTINTSQNPSGAQLIRDGQNWHLMLAIFGLNQLQNFKIGNNLLNTPVSIFADTVGGIKSPQSMSVFKDSSRFYAFTTNTSPSSFSRIKWPETCTSNPIFSTDPTGFQAVAGGGGFQQITLTATAANGATNSFTDSIYVSPTPTPFFTVASACEGFPVQFLDSSYINPGTIGSWTWDFGDGSAGSSVQNPMHNYASNGSFLVTLNASSTAGCTAVYSDSITISPVPDADFSFVNNQCQRYQVNFNDLSQAFGSSTIISWSWDFGDGSPLVFVQNPIHSFDTTGTFSVKLLVTTNSGCIDSLIKNITILPTPIADFAVASTCIGETASFTNLTQISGGGSINYNWNFGDGGVSVLTNPLHQYTALAGNYLVQLIATATNGCSDTIITDIRIANKPTPQFSWTPLTICQGNQVSFANSSFGTGIDTISNYIWSFGDLTTSTDENPFHVYADTGTFTVTLTAIAPIDCENSISQSVSVIPGPSATFTFNNVCLNGTTTFNPSVTTPPGTQIDSIVWDFGDGTTFTGLTSPGHIYLVPGSYYVQMTAYNDIQCTGSFGDTVVVYPLPQAAFVTTNLCSGSDVIFDGTLSSVSGDSLTSWLWNFDGLGTASDSIAAFTFAQSGTYDVTLITGTIHGCTDTIVNPVTILQAPDFDFTFTDPCLGGTSVFTFISNITPAPSATMLWDFGDGSLSSLQAPIHTYGSADTFDVKLQVTYASNLCSSQLVKQLIIKPIPDAGFAVINNCVNLPLNLTDTSSVMSGSIVSWNWNLGTLGSSNLQNPVISTSVGGTYPVTLTVTSNEGCTASATGSMIVFAQPEAAFVPDPIFGSPPLTVNFINNTLGGINYEWTFGDGSISSINAPTHVYQDTGNYNITMIAFSAEGCRDTAYSSVSVLIPKMDIQVRKIGVTQQNGLVRLSAEIVNVGNVVVNEIAITGVIENGSVLVEEYNGTLSPGQLLNYNFISSYEIDDNFTPGYYCVEAINTTGTQDVNLANNKKCAVANADFEIFTAYPNPFDSELQVNFNIGADGLYEVKLYDQTGKLVAHTTDNKGLRGFNSAKLDTRSVSKGTYNLVIIFRDEQRSVTTLKIK